MIVYDFEQAEIPKIYGFDTQVQLGIFGENVRWILLKFIKKSDLYVREEK